MSSPPTSLTPTALLPSTSTFATGLPRLISTPRSRHTFAMIAVIAPMPPTLWPHAPFRSEEHTSELQSLMHHTYAVLSLKKKPSTHDTIKNNTSSLTQQKH